MNLGKKGHVYFLTAYVEYLLDEGIRSEEYYLGDASRFLRHLLARTSADDVERYITGRTRSKTYRARLRKTLRKFYTFAEQRLHIPFSEKDARAR